MESLESEAVANGLESVFAFTYVPDFFGKLGFVEVDRHQLPSQSLERLACVAPSCSAATRSPCRRCSFRWTHPPCGGTPQG